MWKVVSFIARFFCFDDVMFDVSCYKHLSSRFVKNKFSVDIVYTCIYSVSCLGIFNIRMEPLMQSVDQIGKMNMHK